MAREVRFIIFTLLSVFPYNIRNKTFFPKHFIAQFLQICLLIIINRDKDHAIVCQQIAGKRQARQHEGKPGRMAGTSTTRHSKYLLCTLGTDIQAIDQIVGREAELIVIYKTI